jgi:ferredoxin
MAFVIAEPCIGTKDAACINVCPVDCIHPRQDAAQFDEVTQLYIDPDTCIDCGACVPECPVTAIFPLEDVPENWREYIDKNADWFRMSAGDYQAKWNEPGKAA